MIYSFGEGGRRIVLQLYIFVVLQEAASTFLGGNDRIYDHIGAKKGNGREFEQEREGTLKCQGEEGGSKKKGCMSLTIVKRGNVTSSLSQ